MTWQQTAAALEAAARSNPPAGSGAWGLASKLKAVGAAYDAENVRMQAAGTSGEYAAWQAQYAPVFTSADRAVRFSGGTVTVNDYTQTSFDALTAKLATAESALAANCDEAGAISLLAQRLANCWSQMPPPISPSNLAAPANAAALTALIQRARALTDFLSFT